MLSPSWLHSSKDSWRRRSYNENWQRKQIFVQGHNSQMMWSKSSLSVEMDSRRLTAWAVAFQKSFNIRKKQNLCNLISCASKNILLCFSEATLISQYRSIFDCCLATYKYKSTNYNSLNYWVMHPVARVSINIYRNLRTQQMSVLVLLCTFTLHVSVLIGGHLQVVCNTKILRQLLYTSMSTDPLRQYGEFKQSTCHKI
jgi:hypothetical protein